MEDTILVDIAFIVDSQQVFASRPFISSNPGSSLSWSYGSWIYNYLYNISAYHH